MRNLVDTLMHPRRTPPPPIDVDLARVMGVGTVVWLGALAVVGVLFALDLAPARWVGVCVAGAVLGVLGFLWARRNGHLSADGTGAMVRDEPQADQPQVDEQSDDERHDDSPRTETAGV